MPGILIGTETVQEAVLSLGLELPGVEVEAGNDS